MYTYKIHVIKRKINIGYANSELLINIGNNSVEHVLYDRDTKNIGIMSINSLQSTLACSREYLTF